MFKLEISIKLLDKLKHIEIKMSDGILGKAHYRCSNCGQEYKLSSNDIIFETESASERTMGNELQHRAYIDEKCTSCNQEIYLTFEVWEYPIGIINDTTNESSGAEIIDSNFSIYHCPPEPDSDDGSRVLGAAAGGAIFGASIGGPFGALIGGIIGGLVGDSVQKGGKKNG